MVSGVRIQACQSMCTEVVQDNRGSRGEQHLQAGVLQQTLCDENLDWLLHSSLVVLSLGGAGFTAYLETVTPTLPTARFSASEMISWLTSVHPP